MNLAVGQFDLVFGFASDVDPLCAIKHLPLIGQVADEAGSGDEIFAEVVVIVLAVDDDIFAYLVALAVNNFSVEQDDVIGVDIAICGVIAPVIPFIGIEDIPDLACCGIGERKLDDKFFGQVFGCNIVIRIAGIFIKADGSVLKSALAIDDRKVPHKRVLIVISKRNYIAGEYDRQKSGECEQQRQHFMKI